MLSLLPRAIQKRLVLGSIRIDRTRLRDVRVKVATTHDEIFGAARLVHDAYVAKGLIAPHPTGLMLHPQMVLPSTVTFVAVEGKEVVGTLSLIVDSPLGLPVDRTFTSDLRELREGKERIAEVSALSVAPRMRSSGVVYLLNRIMVRHALRTGIERLLLCVAPRAERLYEIAMLFERLGGERAYEGLASQAVAMTLSLRGAQARFREAFAHLGPVPGNTYYLHQEMRCPLTEELAPGSIAASETRTSATEALARARMDVFRALGRDELAFLRREVKGVLWPSPSRPEIDMVVPAGALPAPVVG